VDFNNIDTDIKVHHYIDCWWSVFFLQTNTK